MADTTVEVIPRRVTLGNILSIVTTVVVAAFVVGSVWALLGKRISDLEDTVDKFPTTYARQADFERLVQDAKLLAAEQKASQGEARDANTRVLEKINDASVTIGKLEAKMDSVTADLTDIRRALEIRRRSPAETP